MPPMHSKQGLIPGGLSRDQSTTQVQVDGLADSRQISEKRYASSQVGLGEASGILGIIQKLLQTIRMAWPLNSFA